MRPRSEDDSLSVLELKGVRDAEKRQMHERASLFPLDRMFISDLLSHIE